MVKMLDPRPSKADSAARAARKAFERENPHFDMQEFGMKAGALALLTAAVLFPWEKEYEKHERTHHPERFEDGGKGPRKAPGSGKEKGGDERGRRDSRGDGDDDGDRNRDRDRRRRRQSEGGDRAREYRTYLDRDREYRAVGAAEVAPSSVGGGGVRAIERERTYTGSDDGEYGRRYIEASRKERERREREIEYGRRRRGSVDYEYRRMTREERRR